VGMQRVCGHVSFWADGNDWAMLHVADDFHRACGTVNKRDFDFQLQNLPKKFDTGIVIYWKFTNICDRDIPRYSFLIDQSKVGWFASQASFEITYHFRVIESWSFHPLQTAPKITESLPAAQAEP